MCCVFFAQSFILIVPAVICCVSFTICSVQVLDAETQADDDAEEYIEADEEEDEEEENQEQEMEYEDDEVPIALSYFLFCM